ncbi:DUF4265 domain-containing protein [Glycomyces buryatensis]|nr:DUF4265 domain-containing protein [Glycomyces buryatensis]
MTNSETSSSEVTEQERLFSIAFDLPDDIAAYAPAPAEKIWAAKTEVKMEVEVRNIPFYVKSIAYGDIVRVRVDHDRRELVFDEFVAESGNSTLRILLKDQSVVSELQSVLRMHGCDWEIDANEVLLAVDVPATGDFRALSTALDELHEAGLIGVQEAAISNRHR